MSSHNLGALGRAWLNVPLAVWLGFIGSVLVFHLYPEIDLAVSRLFYVQGEGFALKGAVWERALHHSVTLLTLIVNLGLIALWWFGRRRRWRRLPIDGRRLAFLLALLILIPGLLVNQILKGQWGRPRPVAVSEFGGDQRFVPAFVRSDQGGGSLSSGHVAAAAYLTVAAATLAGRGSAWTWLAGLYTLAVCFARVAAGGHFLSDVLTSVFLVWIGQGLLRGVFVVRWADESAPR